MGGETEAWNKALRQIRNLLVSAMLDATNREILQPGWEPGPESAPRSAPRAAMPWSTQAGRVDWPVSVALAQPVPALPTGRGWVFEMKVDGSSDIS